MAGKKTKERFSKLMRIVLFIISIVLMLAGIFCITEKYFSMRIKDWNANWKYIVESWAILLSIVSSFIFLVIMLMLFFPKTRFAKSIKKILNILIPNCLIERFNPGKLDEIEPNSKELENYFGEKSFIRTQYLDKITFRYDTDSSEKDRLKHGLLKPHRHFFRAYFYVFLYGGLFLHSILLRETFNEFRMKDSTNTKSEESIIITKAKAVVPITCCSEMMKDSIFITKYITLDTTCTLSFPIEKYCWDKFTVDNIFGIPINFNDEKNMIYLTLDISKYKTSCDSTTDKLNIIDKMKSDTLFTIESKPCQNINTVVFLDKNKKIKYHFNVQDSLIFKKQIKTREIITNIQKNSENITLNPFPEKPYPLSRKDTLEIKKTDNYLSFGLKRQKDVNSLLINLLSMLSNVFLLVFFGFLNAKTDIFEHEINNDNYLWLKQISIVGFVLICLIDVFAIFIGIPSIHFAIETITAIVSVIAIFGVWGSLKNSYTDFGWVFTLAVFIYAASQILAVFLDNKNNNPDKKVSVSDIMTISMLFIVLIGKIFIIFKILRLFNTKRLSWFFLNEVNNGRTDSYEKFMNLF